MSNKNLVHMIEELAANAWPAAIQQQLEGWRLRATNGVTRRANSVFTAGDMPDYKHWRDEVSGFYSRRGLPSRYQVSTASPAGLDAMLGKAGYSAEAYTSVQTSDINTVLERSAGREYEAFLSNSLDEEWLGAFMRLEGMDSEKKETYRRIYSAIGPRTCYALVREGGEAGGVGMAVAERGWAGLFGIVSDARVRGRGIATSIVHNLADWSSTSGAKNLYLQVMRDNSPALNLYGKLGFRELYEYHYRTNEA